MAEMGNGHENDHFIAEQHGRNSARFHQTESAFEAASREGGAKFIPVSLAFMNVNYVVTMGRGKTKKDKIIIDNVSGYVKEGTFVAIMGPSGSGKTSLLNILAGRVAEAGNTQLTGEVLVNGKERGQTFKRVSAYVMQDDIMFSTLTVWETLITAAELRLPSAIPKARKFELVDSIIMELGLSKARNTKIGNAVLRGVSGGERKRTNIAIEMLSNPSLIFLDEPTSGLDSFQALNVMQTMSDLAQSGRTVLSTIHQPRSSIFQLFETLILLSEGRLIYYGAASEAVAYFERLNYKCPTHFNPADYFMDIISTDRRDESREAESSKRIQILASAYTPAEYVRPDLHMKSILGNSDDDFVRLYGLYASSYLTQLRVLFRRSWWQISRDRLPLIISFVQAIVMVIVISVLYSNTNNGQKGVQNREGVIFFVAVFFAFNGVFQMITTFPLERGIINRERAANSYRVAAYYPAKVLSEWIFRVAPILVFVFIAYWPVNFQQTAAKFFIFLLVAVLEFTAMSAVGLLMSSVAPTPQTALALGPLSTVIFMLFGGFYINIKSIPVWIRWFSNCSPILWGFIGLATNEFRGINFTCNDAQTTCVATTGDQVLRNLSIDSYTVWESIGWQCLVIVVLHALAYSALTRNGPRIQPLASLKKEATKTVEDSDVPEAPQPSAV